MLNLVVHWLLGFTVWMPAFALVAIRNTGLQFAHVWTIVIAGLVLLRGARVSREASLGAGAWLAAVLLSAAIPGTGRVSLLATVNYLFPLILVVGLASSRRPEALRTRNCYVEGYLAGGAASAAYAVYQYFVLETGHPSALLLSNNPSFPLLADRYAADYANFVRSFGVTPEPSVLSSLLVPGIVFLALKIAGQTAVISPSSRANAYALLALFCLGLGATSSLGILLLPVTMLIVVPLLSFRLKIPRRVFIVLPLAIVGAVILAWWLARVELASRIQNLATDPSFAIRGAAALTALRILAAYPLFGTGVGSAGDEFLALFPLAYEKDGVDSLPLMIGANLGIAGLLALGLLVWLATRRIMSSPESAREALPYRGFFIATMLVFTVQTGYLTLFHFWAALGLAMGTPRRASCRGVRATS